MEIRWHASQYLSTRSLFFFIICCSCGSDRIVEQSHTRAMFLHSSDSFHRWIHSTAETRELELRLCPWWSSQEYDHLSDSDRHLSCFHHSTDLCSTLRPKRFAKGNPMNSKDWLDTFSSSSQVGCHSVVRQLFSRSIFLRDHCFHWSTKRGWNNIECKRSHSFWWSHVIILHPFRFILSCQARTMKQVFDTWLLILTDRSFNVEVLILSSWLCQSLLLPLTETQTTGRSFSLL